MITASMHLKHIYQCNKSKTCSSSAITRFRSQIPIIGSRLCRYNNNCITSITVGFPLIRPYFAIISNFIGKYHLLATQASPNEEEVTDEVISQILTTIINAPRANRKVCTAVERLCEAGNLSAAARILQSLRDKHIFPSPLAYNILLVAASERHDIDLLSQVFKDLVVSKGPLSPSSYLKVAKAFRERDDGVLLRFIKEVSGLTSPCVTVLNRIIFAFAECGQVDKALLIYDMIKSLTCKPDLVTYNTVMDILGRAGRTNEMLHEFAFMKEAGIVPDIVSYNTLLNNLQKVGRLDLCQVYYREMGENRIGPDLLTYTALIHSFGRSGNIEESIRLFNEMKLKQIRPSIYVYRSLVNDLKKMGKVELAMKYLEEMNSCLSELAGPNDFKRKKR